MAAKQSKLNALHEAVAEMLLLIVQGNKIEYTDEETGELVTKVIPPSAAELQAAAKFLKDNDITGAPDEGSSQAKLTDKFKAMTEQREAKRKELAEKMAAADKFDMLDGLPLA